MRSLALWLCCAASLAGCAGIDSRIASYGDLSNPVELTGVPFYSQERYQCGPAALTTLLVSSAANTSLEAVTEQVYLPGRQGSLQAELIAATRANERIPYVLDGSLRTLIAELEAGRPVLVLQNLGVSWYPRWHYAVVVGIDPAADRVILRSGTERRRLTPTRTFLRTWKRGDYWALVTLEPGELPATAEKAHYVAAVAGVAATGHTEAAYAGWQAGLARWPEDTNGLFGLASAAYDLERYNEAERLYRQLLRSDPDQHPARNNLAYALLAQGQRDAALAEIERILERIAADDERRSVYEDSYRDIARR
jgi:tetratricopeptide (TPR) repeat protein